MESLENAVMVHTAISGSTNSLRYIPASAHAGRIFGIMIWQIPCFVPKQGLFLGYIA